MKIRSGVELLEESEGSGQVVKKGDTVEVRLNGWLSRGKQIQKDYVGSFIMGSRTVIPGIECAIEGMRNNGKRKVKISPHLGYKKEGVKDLIPPNALLIYEVEVLNVNSST